MKTMQKGQGPEPLSDTDRIVLYYNRDHKNSVDLKEYVEQHGLPVECIEWKPGFAVPRMPVRIGPRDFPVIRVGSSKSKSPDEYRGKKAYDFINEVFDMTNGEDNPRYQPAESTAGRIDSRGVPRVVAAAAAAAAAPQPGLGVNTRPLSWSTHQLLVKALTQTQEGRKVLLNIFEHSSQQEVANLKEFLGISTQEMMPGMSSEMRDLSLVSPFMRPTQMAATFHNFDETSTSTPRTLSGLPVKMIQTTWSQSAAESPPSELRRTGRESGVSAASAPSFASPFPSQRAPHMTSLSTQGNFGNPTESGVSEEIATRVPVNPDVRNELKKGLSVDSTRI